MPKFRLLGGKFTDPATGKEYNAGDGAKGPPRKYVTVTSDLELDAMYRNKFERLDGPTKHGPEGEDPAWNDAQTDAPPQAVKRKMDKRAAAPQAGYKPDRNRKMTTSERAEIMTEEVDDDGTTEDSREATAKQEAKAKQLAAIRAKADREDEDEEATDDEAEATDEEEEAEEAPKPARRGRASRAKKTR
jgi:hypothetical protein